MARRVITRCVADLKAQLYKAEPRTSVFVAGLPAFASFQVAYGPLIRGVYRDSTLRGYDLSQFTHDRGVFMSSALGQVMNGRLDVAEAALEAARLNGEDDIGRPYLSAVVALGLRDRERAVRLFRDSGHGTGGDGPGLLRASRRQLDAKDSLGALLTMRRALREDVMSPECHSLAADLMLSHPETQVEGQVESYIAMLLAPESPSAWRRWAFVLAIENRQAESIAALERYFELYPEARTRDPDALRLRDFERRLMPGGDLAQRAMKQELAR